MESKVGEGSCFTIELPMGVGETETTEGSEINKGGAPEAERSEIKKGGSPEEHQARFTVLYVEDHPINRALVEAILLTRGDIKLLLAPEAKLGLELARAHRPDLILMDIHLPGIDGISALKHLQTCEETRAIPVIAISADALPKDIDQALAAGFKHYLTKPIQGDRLLELMDDLLGKKAD